MVEIKKIYLQITISSDLVDADRLRVDLVFEVHEPYSS